MRTDWKDRILELKHRTTEAEDEEFLALVDEVMGKCTPEVTKTLMQTFTGEEDYEVQESVISVLASAPPEVYQVALLAELPRLLGEAPEWAETLIGREVHSRPSLLASTARKMDETTKANLVQLLTRSSFAEFFPNSKQVVQEVAER
jgi:hypothetical protein